MKNINYIVTHLKDIEKYDNHEDRQDEANRSYCLMLLCSLIKSKKNKLMKQLLNNQLEPGSFVVQLLTNS